jgi:hypothetical protein
MQNDKDVLECSIRIPDSLHLLVSTGGGAASNAHRILQHHRHFE